MDLVVQSPDELLAAVPKIAKPQRSKAQKTMKGRPITGEEFDRMLDKVETVVGAGYRVPDPIGVTSASEEA